MRRRGDFRKRADSGGLLLCITVKEETVLNFIMNCHSPVRVLCLTSSLYHCSRDLRSSTVINNNFLTMVGHAPWELDLDRKGSVNVEHLFATES